MYLSISDGKRYALYYASYSCNSLNEVGFYTENKDELFKCCIKYTRRYN